MNLFENNTTKAIIILATFIISISIGLVIGNTNYSLFAIIPVVIAYLFNWKMKNILLICSVVFVLGINYAHFRIIKIEKNDISNYIEQKEVNIIGRITSEANSTYLPRHKFSFKVERIFNNGSYKEVSGNLMVILYDKFIDTSFIQPGFRLKLKGNLYIPREATNPYSFDYRKYLLNKGITSSLYANWEGYQVLSSPDDTWDKLLCTLNMLKRRIQYVHNMALKPSQAQLLGGIVLGERAIPMDKEIKNQFIHSGLVHILAASGINVALLGLAWIFVTSRIALPPIVQIPGAMVIVIIYSLLTGLPPSVMRATLMLELILLGKLINKDANMLSIIFFAAALLLIINPLMIVDIGFQLSFVTAFGLIITVPVFQKYIKTLPQWLAMLVIVPFIAQLWAMPILLYNFQSVATYSLVANFLAMPLVAVITYVGFMSSVLSIFPVIGIDVSLLLDRIIGPVLSLLLDIAAYVSSLPGSIGFFSIDSVVAVFAFYLIIAVFIYALWKEYSFKKHLLVLTSIIILLLAFNLFVDLKHQMKIIFFDTGKSDCTFIRTPDGKNILIDGGDRRNEDNNSAKWLLISFLHRMRISNIDCIYLTHPENDHIGGIPELLEAFNVDSYVDNGSISDNNSYNLLLLDLLSTNINYNILRNNDSVRISEEVNLKIISPEEKLNIYNDNNYKLV